VHDVSLTLPAGTTIAIVGDNGAGESTLVKLLAGLYPPSSGRITIDGTNLAHLNPEQWRHHLSAAFQDHARFEFLIRDTVGIGDLEPATTPPPFTPPCTAPAPPTYPPHSQPASTPNSARTGPAGIDLSGGQWQKLALSRACSPPRSGS